MSIFKKIKQKRENDTALKCVAYGMRFNYFNPLNKRVFGGATCISNDVESKVMFVKFEYVDSDGVDFIEYEMILYSDARLKNHVLLNLKSKDGNSASATSGSLEETLKAEIKNYESKELYERAAVLQEAINKLNSLK